MSSVLLLLFGLLGSTEPTKAAVTGDAEIVFQGIASSSGPLAYPCLGWTGFDPTACPVIGGNGTMVVNTPTGTTSMSVPIGGRTVGYAFSSTVCVGRGLRLSPTAVGAGTCTMSAAGLATGSCRLMTARGQMSVDVSLPLVSTPWLTFTVDYAFTDIAGRSIVTGRVIGGTVGYVVGIVETAIVPAYSGGTTVGNSCSNQTATVWLMTGRLALVTAT